jgi:hypothetical protein
MSFDESIDDLSLRLREELAKRVLAAAVLLQAETKRDYSRSNPRPHNNPAPRGEFPRGRTWNLRDGIAIIPATVEGVMAEGGRVRVGYLPAAFYGVVLANKGWKGIKDTYVRVRQQLAKILGA